MRLAEALGAQLGRLAGGVGLVADGGQPPPAQAEQVFGGRPGRGHVVDADVVERAVAGPLAQDDQRQVRVAVGEVGLVEAERAEDDPVEEQLPRAAGDERALVLRVAVGLVDQNVVAALARAARMSPCSSSAKYGVSRYGTTTAIWPDRPWPGCGRARSGR